MRGLRQSMENEAVSQIPAIPVRVERYSPCRLRAPPEVVTCLKSSTIPDHPHGTLRKNQGPRADTLLLLDLRHHRQEGK